MATTADLPSVASLMHESFVEYRSSYTDEGFAATTPTSEQLLKRMKEGPIWVALNDDVLVGTVSIVPRKDELYIRGMAVLPQARGLRLGELLLKTVEDYAIENNYKRLVLSSTPFLTRALRLYERWGFQRTAEPPDDLFGTPLITMRKELVALP